jgi:MoaA/NifB/PqqE/SkfB family radical SAM enzyme
VSATIGSCMTFFPARQMRGVNVVAQACRFNFYKTMNLRTIFYDCLTVLGVVINRQPLCGPRIVQISICDECNLACVMCNRRVMGAHGMFDYDRMIELMAELYPMGMRELFYHGFGEPCLHPRLPEMIRHARIHYPLLKQHIITNGTWKSEDLMDEIIRADVKVRVSVHGGDQQTWQSIHPDDDPSLFEQTRRNLHRLASVRPDHVEILYVMTNRNCDRIGPMLDLAAATGVRHILFRPMRLFPDPQGKTMNRDLMLSHSQYEKLRTELLEIVTKTKGIFDISAVPFWENSYDDDLGRPSSRNYYLKNSCFIGSVLTVIGLDGTVWGCVEESSENAPLGNLNDNSFRKIWWGEPYFRFRERQLFRDKESLIACGCYSFCQHLGINRKLNNFRRLRLCALWRNLLNW